MPPIWALAKYALKSKSPRFVSEAQKDYPLLICPRYMNVPLPAPCHVNVAGIGQQSVWGLRIIARSQLSLWHYSANSSIPKSGWDWFLNIISIEERNECQLN